MNADPSNKSFDIAVKFVNQTSHHIFLTGKAGTGKTTFLKFIKEHCHKNLAVVAPTGIAAINAGGVTIHSLFQLPLGNFIPDGTHVPNGNFYNRHGLLKQLRLTSSKRKIIQELELLIIDEVSMVRADLLDAMDAVLKSVRRQPHVPFGGVQLLYIGDLFQLPPVVNDEAWAILKNYYKSPFFYHAQCVVRTPPLYLELKKIYRQNDDTFIKILNNLRNNLMTEGDIEFLNQYYRPDFKPAEKGEYITLTTHNNKADLINKKELDKLHGKLYSFDATIEGDFNDKTVPAEAHLQLKQGAQIMFIRNDKGESKRYYNGKIGIVNRIENNDIYVLFSLDKAEIKLEKEKWRNIQYQYNSESDQIEEKVLGTFTQYPIRLAWAITIHKSQGLTFSKAIIDAGSSFAPGQVYVALSRLTSLDGLVLYSPIQRSSILTNEEALSISSRELTSDDLMQQLKKGQEQYVHHLLLNVFNWNKLVFSLEQFYKEFESRKIPAQAEAETLLMDLIQKAQSQKIITEKFIGQLKRLLQEADNHGYETVSKRVNDASNYFSDLLLKELFTPLESHYNRFKNFEKVKKYLKELRELTDVIKNKKNHLMQAMKLTEGLMHGADIAQLLQRQENRSTKEIGEEEELSTIESPKPKQPKGASHRISLDLLKSGMKVFEISEKRGLAISTIESHLISFIRSGELDIKEFVSEEKINVIQQIIQELGVTGSTPVKEKLGKDYSYSEIRAVISYNQRKEKEEGVGKK